MDIVWICKKFGELKVQELYDVIRLRNEVFVVEQKCIFQDADGYDPITFHILGYDAQSPSTLVVYSRLFGPGDKYEYPAISRVVSDRNYRSKGAGRALVGKAIEMCHELYGNLPIKIGAQYYLKRFYESFGFVQSGEVYDEDGIDHIVMIKPSI
jgi:ElaA protein